MTQTVISFNHLNHYQEVGNMPISERSIRGRVVRYVVSHNVNGTEIKYEYPYNKKGLIRAQEKLDELKALSELSRSIKATRFYNLKKGTIPGLRLKYKSVKDDEDVVLLVMRKKNHKGVIKKEWVIHNEATLKVCYKEAIDLIIEHVEPQADQLVDGAPVVKQYEAELIAEFKMLTE